MEGKGVNLFIKKNVNQTTDIRGSHAWVSSYWAKGRECKNVGK